MCLGWSSCQRDVEAFCHRVYTCPWPCICNSGPVDVWGSGHLLQPLQASHSQAWTPVQPGWFMPRGPLAAQGLQKDSWRSETERGFPKLWGRGLPKIPGGVGAFPRRGLRIPELWGGGGGGTRALWGPMSCPEAQGHVLRLSGGLAVTGASGSLRFILMAYSHAMDRQTQP